jgi:hypothetical protein
MPTRSLKQAHVSVFVSQLILLIVSAAIGYLIGRVLGCIFFVGFAALYIALAAFSAGRYPFDLHDSKVIDSDRAPETLKFTNELSKHLGMDSPEIYYLDIAQPQICVSATGYGEKMRSKIGITRALLREADAGKLRVLLSLAVARIYSGHASALSSVVAFSGMFFQLAQSDGVNNLPLSKFRDPETELGPVGGFLLSAWSHVACNNIKNAKAKELVLEADSSALNIGPYSYRPEYIDSALRWLSAKQFPQAQDPIATYNPAEVLLYLVSPFESENSRVIESDRAKPWKKSIERVTCMMPTLDERMNSLKSHPNANIQHQPIIHEEQYSGTEPLQL